jgi:hypothetical protein
VCIDTQCRVGIRDGQGVCSGSLSSLCHNSNKSNSRRELDPKRTRRDPACRLYDRAKTPWVQAELDSPLVYVRTRDVQFVPGHPVRLFQYPDHFKVAFDRFPEYVRNHLSVVTTQHRQLLGYEGSHSDVLKTNGVDHPRRRVANPRGGRTRHRLGRQSLHHDPAETIQVYEVCEFNAIAKSATRGNYGVFEGKGTDVDAEVNFPGPSPSWGRLRFHRQESTTQVKI